VTAMRYFSVDEATGLLPRLTELIGTLRQLRDQAVVKRARIERLWGRLDSGERVLSEIGEEQRVLDGLSKRLVAVAGELESIGCVLRDLDLGLVDFPFRAGASAVFLCWKIGEPGILFWHGTDEGFAGRRPIANLPGDPA
jgi:hypothetical protein